MEKEMVENKKVFGFNAYFFLLICIAILVLSQTSFAAEPERIIITTTDLNQEYEIIGVSQCVADVSTSFGKDPFDKALAEAMSKVLNDTLSVGGDAVIGYRTSIVNFSGSYVGKVIAYGTIVKFKK